MLSRTFPWIRGTESTPSSHLNRLKQLRLNRFLFCFHRIFLSFRRWYREKEKLVPVYVICFMNFCLSHTTNQLVYHYQIREQESGEFYGNQLSIVLCELPRFILEPDRKLSPVEEWFEILRNMSNFTARPAHVNKRFDPIFEASRQTRLVELEQQQYFRAMLTEEEKQDIATAYLKRGREEGREEGRLEGREEATRETARKLLQLGVAVETIVAATGLLEETVVQLQEQSSNS